MIDRSVLTTATAFALLLIAAPAAHANDGEFNGSGATVYPVESAAIALDEEDLSIRQTGPAVGEYVDSWSVRVVYRFRNTTDAPVTVQMGFPERCHAGPDEMDTPEDVCVRPTILDFTAEVDGKRIETTVKKPKGGVRHVLEDVVFQRVHTFPVTFAPNQTRSVVHTYRLHPSIITAYTSVMEYILQTGGLWVGKIRRLDVAVTVWDRFEEVNVQGDAVPKPKKAEKDGWTTYTWHFENYEPTWDLEMHFVRPIGLDRGEALFDACGHSDEELAGMSAAALRLLRNRVYAAYGYTFKKADMRAHFEKQPWYRPRPDYDPKWISKSHQSCIRRFKDAERKAR